MSTPPLNLALAELHVELLTGDPRTPIYVRLFHDDRELRKLKDEHGHFVHPTENYYGVVADLWPKIEDAQRRGYGAFLQVNEALPPEKLKKSEVLSPDTEEIVRVRALITDEDDMPEPEYFAEPSFQTIRDDTHRQSYWLTRDVHVNQFKHWQRRLIETYDSDGSVHDLPRVLRLAGTLHQKPGKEPSLVTLKLSDCVRSALGLKDLVGRTILGPAIQTLARPVMEIAPLLKMAEPRPSVPDQSTTDPRALTVANYRKVLSFIDPTFADKQRGQWVGIMQCILKQRVPLILEPGEEAPDPEELAYAWCRGDLWRERTGDQTFTVATFTEDCVHDARDGDYSGLKTRLGTLGHFASANGYRGFLDDRPLEEQFPGILDQLGKPEWDPLADPEPLPDFDLDTLPPVLRTYVEAISNKLGVDRAGVAWSALTTLSGAIDHRNTLALDPDGSWLVSPRLWTLLIGSSAAKKSPMMEMAVRPLHAALADSLSSFSFDRSAYEEQQKRIKRGETCVPELPEPTTPVQYISKGGTIEGLATLLRTQPRGVLLHYDEAKSLFGSFGRYSGAADADRADFLQLWNGGVQPIARAKGAPVIPNWSASVLGAMPPEVLAKVMSDLDEDGLLQRFVLVRLNKAHKGERRVKVPDDYGRLVRRLTQLGPHHHFSFDPEGYTVTDRLESWQSERQALYDGPFSSALGKTMNHFGALAMILHLAADASPSCIIPGQIAANAEQITGLLIEHARAVYEGDTEHKRRQKLAGYILRSRQERFVVSDFTNDVPSLKNPPILELQRLLRPFVRNGWLTDDDGGRTFAWKVVPGLRERNKERIARLNVEYDELKARMLPTFAARRLKKAS